MTGTRVLPVMTEAGPQKLIATTDEKSDVMNMVKSVLFCSVSGIISINMGSYL
jgi:hypothetical protein